MQHSYISLGQQLTARLRDTAKRQTATLLLKLKVSDERHHGKRKPPDAARIPSADRRNRGSLSKCAGRCRTTCDDAARCGRAPCAVRRPPPSAGTRGAQTRLPPPAGGARERAARSASKPRRGVRGGRAGLRLVAEPQLPGRHDGPRIPRELRLCGACRPGVVRSAARHSSSAFWCSDRETLYPDHSHRAAEVYHVIAGSAEWWRDGEDWITRPPGAVITHAPAGAPRDAHA